MTKEEYLKWLDTYYRLKREAESIFDGGRFDPSYHLVEFHEDSVKVIPIDDILSGNLDREFFIDIIERLAKDD
jgi:hypothetical protein